MSHLVPYSYKHLQNTENISAAIRHFTEIGIKLELRAAREGRFKKFTTIDLYALSFKYDKERSSPQSTQLRKPK